MAAAQTSLKLSAGLMLGGIGFVFAGFTIYKICATLPAPIISRPAPIFKVNGVIIGRQASLNTVSIL